VVRVNKPVALLRLVLAAVSSLPLLAQAAGLGRLSVQSFLGQPLRAEIEVVSLQPGEESSLEARLASGNAFAQAGIEFNPALSGIQFTLDKRDGRAMILVSTRQPVNEPFVDLLVELRWSTGLFVREYTVLLDPPGYEGPKPPPMAAAPVTTPSAAPASAAPVATPSAPSAEAKPAPSAAEQPMAAAPAAEPRPAPAEEPKPPAEESKPPAEESKPPAEESKPPAAMAAPAPTPQAAPSAQTYEVKKGDTLGEIALQYRPQGVTFHQMLIALQRANEDAFINSNINLVRAGRILDIPDAEAAAAVDVQDANRLVIAQHADFAEYRSRLGIAVAAAPATPQAAERSAAGQITPKTEAPKPAPSKDQLKLSKADPKKPGAPAAKAAREDDLAARERALQEAQSRVAELERNVSDLQKLLEIRNQQLAQMQQKAAAAPVPAPPKPAPAPQAAIAPEAKPAAPSPAPAAPEALKPAASAAPAPAAEAPKPAPPLAPTAVKPKPRPIAAAPPLSEPSLVDEFLGNPVALGGLGGVVLLLAGYGAYAWQRKKKSVSRFQDSVLGAGSIEPGIASMDAGASAQAAPASVQPSSVSQAPVGGMGTDDVDPIAEADVYMAYGRDAQAEEILKEALQKDPNRVPVMAKLLEIYANRRDAPSFEQIALKLKGVTHGAGADWDKATTLGRNVDPGNGLYGGVGAAPAAAFAAATPAAAAAPVVDFDIGGGTSSRPAPEPTPSLDLDLGGPPEKTDFAPSGTLVLDAQESKAASSGLDFDLGGGAEKPADTGGGLNFELPGAAPAAPAPAASTSGGGGLDFDLNLGGGDTKEASAPVDLSAISLDLGTPGDTAAPAGEAQADPKWQEVATKLDLAKAYEEMGDKDGARELLNEVLREGDSAQQGQANQLLAKLG
jgi:pilus assembly protein FimV